MSEAKEDVPVRISLATASIIIALIGAVGGPTASLIVTKYRVDALEKWVVKQDEDKEQRLRVLEKTVNSVDTLKDLVKTQNERLDDMTKEIARLPYTIRESEEPKK